MFIFCLGNSYHLHTTLAKISLPFGFEYAQDQESLYKESVLIPLSSYEKKLLFLLVKNRGQFISTELIRDVVWDNKPVGDNDIRMLIKKIRDKTHKDFIVTAKGIGYKIEK